MLQEENDALFEKVCLLTPKQNQFLSVLYDVDCKHRIMLQLRHAEEKRQEVEIRSRELEKQVNVFASLLTLKLLGISLS